MKKTDNKKKSNINQRTKRLVLTSLMMALCCVGTLVHIPAGPTLGYMHLGDAFVITSGALLGPIYGSIAASIGSAIADLINGYSVYIPCTFIVKGLVALFVGFIFFRFGEGKKNTIKTAVIMLSGTIAELAMTILYYLYDVILLLLSENEVKDLGIILTTSATSIPYNLVQGAFALLITFFIVPVIRKRWVE